MDGGLNQAGTACQDNYLLHTNGVFSSHRSH